MSISKTACAAGGRAKTPAKLTALAVIHASRKGKPVNSPGMPPGTYRRLLADVSRALGVIRPRQVSRRAIARYCKVSARTVGRWLAGVDVAPAKKVSALRRWLAEEK